MPLDTYANLQTAILGWLARPGDPRVQPAVPDMITLFEAEARRRLKTGAAEQMVTLTTLAGVPSLSLPVGFASLRRVAIGGKTLANVAPSSLPGLSGTPLAYTLWGQTALWLGPTPDAAYPVELLYQSGVPALSASNASNWLLSTAPDAYLFGTLVEAEAYIGHDERVAGWLQRREAAFASIEMADRKARWGSPLQIKVDGITSAPGGASGGADQAMAIVSVGDAPPSVQHAGDLWWDSAGGQLYVWYVDPGGTGVWTAATNQPGPGGDAIATVYPSSGDVVSMTGTSLYIATGPLAALTIRLPSSPVIGATVQLSFAAPITALTVQDAAGAPVASAPTNAYGPGAAVIMRYGDAGWIYWK